jgi:uncharacterized protein (DUF2132 family)
VFQEQPEHRCQREILKKTDWAREKVESFYLYKFKSLPRASDEQFELPPRDRIVPPDQTPGEPAELSMEDAERLREKRARKAAEHDAGKARRPSAPTRRPARESNAPASSDADPWAKWRK